MVVLVYGDCKGLEEPDGDVLEYGGCDRVDGLRPSVKELRWSGLKGADTD